MNYYEKVGQYYDEDAPQFENRYWENRTLQQIRKSFRRETEKFGFNTALEVGFGPGVDLIYFAQKFPDRHFFGIDISKEMFRHAEKQIAAQDLHNINLATGSVEDLERLFPGTKYDLIYVYFGALNTVKDLSLAADQLTSLLNPGGQMVITVINKWYLGGMILPLLKLRFNTAFKRLRKTWGGYSPKRELESRCYTPRDVQHAFNKLKCVRRRGYSIFYPAWYQDHITRKLGRFSAWLWKTDKALNYTPFWSLGEYTLFVFSKPGSR